MTGTFEDQVAQLNAIRRGETIEKPPVYTAILSASDSSIAPEGQDVVYLACNVPVAPRDRWPGSKDQYAKTILASVQRYVSGLDTELGLVATSPADFEERYGAPRGCYFHVDMTPFRVAMNRPARGFGGYTTPVAGYPWPVRGRTPAVASAVGPGAWPRRRHLPPRPDPRRTLPSRVPGSRVLGVTRDTRLRDQSLSSQTMAPRVTVAPTRRSAGDAARTTMTSPSATAWPSVTATLTMVGMLRFRGAPSHGSA